MAQAATDAGAKGSFEFCQKTANAIQSAVSSLVTSTTESKLALRHGGASKFTQRDDLVKEDDATVKFDWQYFPIAEHFVYDPNRRDFLLEAALPLAAAHSNPREALRRRSNPPSYLAVNKNYFGKGAERVAFRCRLSDKDRADGFVFDSMIAKETSHVERFDEKVNFHRKFVETQDLASFLATQFNQHLRALPHYEKYPTPQLLFLSCSVLVVNSEGNHRGFLVEKKLDVERFPWTKWNDNNGMVDGKQIHVPLDVDFELKQLEKEKANKSTPGGLLGAITEEEEEEEESDDDDSVSDLEAEAEENHNDGQNDHGAAARDSLGAGIKESDYLQAFTHFTYRYTNKKVMVCDLQGIFNTDMVPPTFELTDPAIHYASTKGRRVVFGRTDKGKSGMNVFFKTHKCNKLCKYMQLSAKNKKWQRSWRRESAQGHNFAAGFSK